MSQTCGKCTRVNPPEASYCFYDGAVLAGHARDGGPVPVGSRPFTVPFVFPDGRQCRSFDELALACQQDWPAARDLLEEGFLETFLDGLGRADLARAARESAHFPDRDRGLDRLLDTLPSGVVEPPRLRVDPLDLHLGLLQVGEDRRFDLQLENQGMRLLYGSAACDDCDWLALGDAPGAPEKLFQFGQETVIPVLVKGKRLRASTRPLEGRLLVESNGGTVSVVIRAEVPPKPFADGVLAGAVTPRQVAEKAKAAPKAAAVFFEKGAVAAWYEENGWTYPVRGPAASGLGAVQQFFEALGLTPPPKVEVGEKAVTLSGAVGASLRHELAVRSEEKRPVYAHATSDQPWLEVGRARLGGRVATIPLIVPRVPDREGETLTARLTVRSNGNQRFVVPVTLVVGGSLDFAPAPKKTLPPVPPPEMPTAPSGIAYVRLLLHALPVLALLLALAAVAAYDLASPKAGGGGRAGDDLLDPEPRLVIDFDHDTQRFGLRMLRERDPKLPDKYKRLTYEEKGTTNNTCVKIDGFEYLLGERPGRWIRREVPTGDGRGYESSFRWSGEDVEVTQTVLLVPGQQTRLLDTCLVVYTVENRSRAPRKVGLRIMIDTFIGANDGVPFVVPGQPGLLNTLRRFGAKEIPDYVQALEHDDLNDPGTVAHLGLKVPGYEDVQKMLICRWPDNSRIKWEIEPFKAMNDPPDTKDSCVTLYWAYEAMNPGEKRRLAFTYGLNTISTVGEGGDGRLALTAGGDFRPGREFTVTAYVKRPDPDQAVRLRLPDGFGFAEGQEADEKVKGGGDYSQVSWRVRAGAAGNHTLEAESKGSRASYRVQVRERSIY